MNRYHLMYIIYFSIGALAGANALAMWLMLRDSKKRKVKKRRITAIMIMLIVAGSLSGCTTTWERPLSGCEKLAVAHKAYLTKRGQTSYITTVRYKNTFQNHALVAEVQDSGKFKYYDPTSLCYPSRDDFTVKMTETKDHSMYGGFTTLNNQ